MRIDRKPRNKTYRVQVIDRTLALLGVLAEEASPVSLGELSKRLALPKSTTLRLLSVLGQHRLVSRVSDGGEYRLGLKLFELGSRAIAHLDLPERARPYLQRLVTSTGETAYLSILDGGETLALGRVESDRAVRVPANIGWRSPAHCTAVGKALLAWLPADELTMAIGENPLRAYTARTITKLEELRAELAGVRARGWALDDEETEEGLRCVAAPVREHSGRVVAAVGILGPAFRLPKHGLEAVAAEVVEVARNLSLDLGCQADASLHEVG